MKKIFFPSVFLALLFVFSCTKNEFTEEKATEAQKDLISYQDSIDRLRDSLNMVGGIIQYSVSVIPVDGSTGFVGDSYKSAQATEMLSGAMVSVAQHGVIKTAATDESGMAVFYDLRVGTVNVSVRDSGYTAVNFIAEIAPENDANVSIYYDVLRHAATMVPVFSLGSNTSTISGIVTYETDLTNTEPEIASGVTVIAMVNVDDPYFRDNYFTDIWDGSFGKYQAEIVQIAYTDLVASAVTDATGAYSIEMPSAADALPLMMEVADVVADQSLLMSTVNSQYVQGVQTIRTIFSTESTITPSVIPTVPAAYVSFSAPTGVITNQPLEDASATAVIGESGIASIAIVNQGDGYTQPPYIEINGDGEGAEAVAYISEGKVTSIEITNAGKGYTYATINPIDKMGNNADADPVFTYSVTSYNVTTNGGGYQSTPDVTVTSSSGSGATAIAIMSGYVSNVTVTNMGSGYICNPTIIFDGSTGSNSSGSDATGTAVMSTNNPIHSILLSDNFKASNFYETAPAVLIERTSEGSGATAIASLSQNGVVGRIEISNAGLGYTEAPAIIISGGGGTGASAYATLNLDGSINIIVTEAGSGYTSNPTVTITAPPTSGTQAVAAAVRAFPINAITLINPGSGYDIVYNTSNVDDYTNEPNVYLDGSIIGTDADVTVRPNMKVESISFNTGSGYESAPSVSIQAKCGSGSGATAVAEVLYWVDGVQVVTPGSGYEYDANVVVTIAAPPAGNFVRAMATASLGSGVLSSIILNDGGENYLAPPHITVNSPNPQPDVDAEVEAVISNGTIVGFTIVNPGENYTYNNPTGFSISITTQTVSANLSASAYTQSGKISFVEIDAPGAGYTTEPMVRFVRVDASGNPVNDAGFTNAEATAVIKDGRVTEINITNPGTGYYYEPDVEIFIPDYLEVAKASVSINSDGYITGVSGLSGGMGYSTAPTVTFTAAVPGMGSGATATAIVKNGTVTKVIMTSNGSDYLGKNTPSSAQGVAFKPTGVALTTFYVFAGKSYVKDIYLGTGKRTIEN